MAAALPTGIMVTGMRGSPFPDRSLTHDRAGTPPQKLLVVLEVGIVKDADHMILHFETILQGFTQAGKLVGEP